MMSAAHVPQCLMMADVDVSLLDGDTAGPTSQQFHWFVMVSELVELVDHCQGNCTHVNDWFDL